VLSGSPPTAEAGVSALALAREQKCATWAGEKTCAVDVRPDWTSIPAPAAPAAAPAAPAAVAQAAKQCETALADLLAKQKIEFATGKAVVLAKSFPLLDEIAKTAKDCPGTIEVQGHTDSVGKAESNKVLSEARAKAVANLLGERGMDTARLKPTGFGPDQPIGDNATAEGRAQNRRIEFRIATN
jgi:outer membrane protein OmpA-like peptidoglycan-associated protein